MLRLRDMIESDIEDYVRWFTTDTEWSNWDAPWEPIESNAEEERKSWTEYYERIKELPEDRVRWKFEIEEDGRHIGWVSSYTDLDYLENKEEIPAIGLDIPETEYRDHGSGTKAFQLFIDYLKKHGHRSFYTQTWSGNQRMMRVAEKLGFTEICRKKDHREVNGRKYDAITYRLDLDPEAYKEQDSAVGNKKFKYVDLREMPELKDAAAEWFHNKWGVPAEAYLKCMNDYLDRKNEYGWYLCLDDERIVAGLGVIENDFHDRKDLKPNICAVYTEEGYRGKRIAGKLLDMAVEDLKEKGISPVYLVTDHTGFYERYGWEFFCMVQGDGEEDMTRMYVHK